MGPAGYSIADPRPIAEDAPYTFYLPKEIAAAGIGDAAKLIFEYHVPVEE
jgi:hypothetical protein